MTTLSRRNFLKLAAGTLSAAALPEPLASLLPQAGADAAVTERVELFVDDEHCLVDGPPWEITAIPRPRREHFGFDAMSLPQRLEFWEQWASDDAFLDFLGKAPPIDEWTAADHAGFDALEARSAAWLNADVSIDEL
jgi:hypothetical protein